MNELTPATEPMHLDCGTEAKIGMFVKLSPRALESTASWANDYRIDSKTRGERVAIYCMEQGKRWTITAIGRTQYGACIRCARWGVPGSMMDTLPSQIQYVLS